MARKARFKISLANKCRMLFGLAVLLIIAAALFVPGYRMEGLVHEMNVRRLRQMALAVNAHCDLETGDLPITPADLDAWRAKREKLWASKQEELAEWWPIYAQTRKLPEERIPKLIMLDPLNDDMPKGLASFIERSIRLMRRRMDVNEAVDWGIEDDGTAIYRFACAVRSPDDHKLRGIIKTVYKPPETVQELWWNRITLVLAGLLAGMLALFVFYLITQKLILSPVRELRRVSEQVTAGDLSVRSQTTTADEFEDLAQAFNTMLEHLQVAQDDLRNANRALDIKLDHLAQANVALFETNQLKSDFLANVSHELRTPMSSIIGFAELLKEAHEGTDDERLSRYAENILTSGRMLLDIINDLLDLAKIEAGKMKLRMEQVDPAAVCRDLTEFVRSLATKQNLRLELDIPEPLPTMTSDAGKIKQILYNLLSNAIKFTPEGGRVTLSAGPEGDDRVRITVSDTGPGIPPDEIDTIFEKFRQIDASRTREHSGTGLGLAISRELALMLGGSVSVSSEENVGSTFTVILPVEAPTPAEEDDGKVVPAQVASANRPRSASRDQTVSDLPR